MRKRGLLRAAVVVGALVLAPASLGASFAPGSDGLGDPMYPLAGNGGYDVANYALTLDYTPSGNRLVGTAVVTARATQNLSRFDLD
ncbi:MAG: M1 family peptidase, partial [Gaiellaceae bacterium]